jgi:hypothetical protein
LSISTSQLDSGRPGKAASKKPRNLRGTARQSRDQNGVSDKPQRREVRREEKDKPASAKSCATTRVSVRFFLCVLRVSAVHLRSRDKGVSQRRSDFGVRTLQTRR